MQYAKFISETEIASPSQEDYNEDGSFKEPSLWLEYLPSEKPTDVTFFKDYEARYSLVSSLPFGIEDRKIVQSWKVKYIEPSGNVGKLSEENIVYPSQSEIVNGSMIFNYDKLPKSRKLEDGWLLIEETAYPQDGKNYIQKGEIIDDAVCGKKIKVVWKEIAMSEVPFSISKKELLDKIVAMGKFETFATILNNNPIIREYWLVSMVLRSDDTLVKSMIPTFVQSFGMTENDVWTLLKSCKSDA